MIAREITLDAKTHSADAIQRAAYRLSERLSLELVRDGDVQRCQVLVATEDAELAEQALHEFRVEVLDQVLRERIRRETEGVRNVILSLAFSHTGLGQQD